MNLLITAGNTQAPIDRVRCLTNIFTGRTGAAIAAAACHRGHQVTLVTSHPGALNAVDPRGTWGPSLEIVVYRTFDELKGLMERRISGGSFDAVVASAAVSDYLVAGTYAPAPGTRFHEHSGSWSSDHASPRLVDRAAGKVKSDEAELWLRLVRAPKLIDLVRTPWGFRGILVKFKLEVGLSEAALLDAAERSRRHSQADWMVANTLESAADWALLGPFPDGYHKISRQELPAKLLDAVETASRAT
jgi:phosphopantothenate---cysteine ligase (CTP)